MTSNTVNLKTKVESMLRERGAKDPIVWRDNRKSTYQQVYDYLVANPKFVVNKLMDT